MDNPSRVDETVLLAVAKQHALPARRIELGGDFYYKCYWLDCDADVESYHSYCWKCGQRLSNGTEIQ